MKPVSTTKVITAITMRKNKYFNFCLTPLLFACVYKVDSLHW